MDEQIAKDYAGRNLAGGGTPTRGLMNANRLADVSTRETAFSVTSNRMDEINARLRIVLGRAEDLHARLFGPQPTNADKPGSAVPTPSGCVPVLEMQMATTVYLTGRLEDMVTALEQLA